MLHAAKPEGAAEISWAESWHLPHCNEYGITINNNQVTERENTAWEMEGEWRRGKRPASHSHLRRGRGHGSSSGKGWKCLIVVWACEENEWLLLKWPLWIERCRNLPFSFCVLNFAVAMTTSMFFPPIYSHDNNSSCDALFPVIVITLQIFMSLLLIKTFSVNIPFVYLRPEIKIYTHHVPNVRKIRLWQENKWIFLAFDW